MQSQGSGGGFDKRTLLAFALMIVVWVVFTQLMPRPKQEPPGTADSGAPRVETSAPVGETPGASTRQDDGPWTAEAAPQESSRQPAREMGFENQLAAEDRTVEVEGDHFRAVFSTRGAALASWELNDYTDAEDEPVELVQDHPGALGLRIESPSGTIDLSHTVFTLEDSWRSEGAGSVRVLRFFAEGEPVGESLMPLRIERTYRIYPSRYDMEMEIQVLGVENMRKDHYLSVAWDHGIPNLETQPKLERGAKGMVALLAEDLVKHNFGGGRFSCGCGGGAASQGGEQAYEGMLRWAGVKGKYFGALLVPDEEVEAKVVARSEPAQSEVGMRLVLPLDYEGSTRYRFAVYAGPLDYWILKDLDDRIGRDVTRLVDFGMKLIAPISKAIYWFLNTVHSVIPNYGVVIVLLAVLMRVVFHPLNVRALRSQRKMQALKPELDALNKTHKDNPELRTKKMMELHKKHGVSPLGSCLPLLVQMPVIYALYNVLMNAIALRKAPFVLWMKDLAGPDTVGEVMGIPINILPLLMAGTMFWQQKMTPTDPRQAPMLILMPLFMVFIFYSLPSGLVLYWTVTNLLAITQQMMMKPVTLAASGTEEKPERTTKNKRRASN
jgi:YidC/Oxa1 family membrane protein insertase